MEICFGEKLKPFVRVSIKVEAWSSSDWVQLQKGFRGNLEGDERPPMPYIYIYIEEEEEEEDRLRSSGRTQVIRSRRLDRQGQVHGPKHCDTVIKNQPCVCVVCLVCSPLCLQYQVGESCAYVNASRTPRDTRNSMQAHLIRGVKRQETAQGALGI